MFILPAHSSAFISRPLKILRASAPCPFCSQDTLNEIAFLSLRVAITVKTRQKTLLPLGALIVEAQWPVGYTVPTPDDGPFLTLTSFPSLRTVQAVGGLVTGIPPGAYNAVIYTLLGGGGGVYKFSYSPPMNRDIVPVSATGRFRFGTWS